MTQTSTAPSAAVTLADLYRGENGDWSDSRSYLELIKLAKTELEGLEAGMHNQTPAARALQNVAWSGQHAALIEIVMAALKAGVSAIKIAAITHRENW
jgi:hypothetical protein